MVRLRLTHLLLLLLAGLPARAEAPVRAALHQRLEHRGAAFEVVTVDLSRARLRLYWRDDSGAILGGFPQLSAHLRRRGTRLLLGTNAGIFEPGQIPTGLHIERRQTLRPLNLAHGEGNFYLQPNGVFYAGKQGAGIVATEQFPVVAGSATEATQSGPLLLLNGAVPEALSPRSRHRKLRSGVCVISPQRVAFGVSRGEVTFYDLATLFRDALGCKSALYLDGTISALYAPELGLREEGRGPFAGLIGVTDR